MFNLLDVSFSGPVVSGDLFYSMFRSVAPHYPAALSFLVAYYLALLFLLFSLLNHCFLCIKAGKKIN